MQTDPERNIQFSQHGYIRLIFNQHNRKWATDFSYPFHLKNVIDRSKTQLNANLFIKESHLVQEKDCTSTILKNIATELAKGTNLKTPMAKFPAFIPILRSLPVVAEPLQGSH